MVYHSMCAGREIGLLMMEYLGIHSKRVDLLYSSLSWCQNAWLLALVGRLTDPWETCLFFPHLTGRL